jgi:hypothetical protein
MSTSCRSFSAGAAKVSPGVNRYRPGDQLLAFLKSL